MTHGASTGGAGILLVSTFTVDRVPLGRNHEFREIPGGPAHYIVEALTRLGVSYRLLTGERAVVEVVRAGDSEEYIIPALPPISLPPHLVGDAVILSPIMREIDPHHIPRVDGMLVADLQGFVREPSRLTGEAYGTYDLTALIQRSQVVKASTTELARLTSDSRDALEGRILIRTLGHRGAYVSADGRETFVPAISVEAAHTIGAGDTFLAGFVSALLDGKVPVEAAEGAARFTEEVLRERREEHWT